MFDSDYIPIIGFSVSTILTLIYVVYLIVRDKTQKTMTIRIHKNPEVEQPYHFTVISPNGQVIATSENYHNFDDMITTSIILCGKNTQEIEATFTLSPHQEKVARAIGKFEYAFKP